MAEGNEPNFYSPIRESFQNTENGSIQDNADDDYDTPMDSPKEQLRKMRRQRTKEKRQQKNFYVTRSKYLALKAKAAKESFTFCASYVNGSCTKREECKLSHNIVPARKMEVCRFFLRDYGCYKKEKCLYMHSEFPCKFFNASGCPYNHKCRFSHAKISKELKKIYLQTESSVKESPVSNVPLDPVIEKPVVEVVEEKKDEKVEEPEVTEPEIYRPMSFYTEIPIVDEKEVEKERNKVIEEKKVEKKEDKKEERKEKEEEEEEDLDLRRLKYSFVKKSILEKK